jgi:outer membrane protein assembly factor BamB
MSPSRTCAFPLACILLGFSGPALHAAPPGLAIPVDHNPTIRRLAFQEKGKGLLPGHWPQWRGVDRRNISTEKGLLDRWPREGPPLLWQVNGLGEGVGTVAIAGRRVYLLGHRGSDECLTALEEATGKPLWSVPLGQAVKEHVVMRWLSQRTPLVDEDRVYAVTARGELVCVRATDGKRLWSKNYRDDFEGQRGVFGVCDQLLVDGVRLVCVPGGPSATVTALHKHTGEPLWKCPLGDRAQYVGAVVSEGGGVRHYVAATSQGLVGVSTSGRLLWRYTRSSWSRPNSCTPNVLGNRLFCGCNYSQGVVLLELKAGTGEVEVKELYQKPLATPAWHEMIVCLGDHAYVGTTRGLVCLELATGAVVWEEQKADGGIAGQVTGTCADGRLYLRGTSGQVALVEANPKRFVLQGLLQIPDAQMKPGSTAPVVAGGRLYLRDDGRLFCYAVTKDVPAGKPVVFAVPPAKALPARVDGKREPDAIFVPTPQDVVEKMLELAKIRKSDVVVDLGCGDGRLVVTAARKYGCKAIGYDLDPECVRMSRENVKKQGVERLVTIEEKDLFNVDLSKVDVVLLYLPPELTRRLIPQLSKLPAGARVVSHAFPIPGITPDRVVTVTSKEDELEHRISVWTAPLKPAGAEK